MVDEKERTAVGEEAAQDLEADEEVGHGDGPGGVGEGRQQEGCHVKTIRLQLALHSQAVSMYVRWQKAAVNATYPVPGDAHAKVGACNRMTLFSVRIDDFKQMGKDRDTHAMMM